MNTISGRVIKQKSFARGSGWKCTVKKDKDDDNDEPFVYWGNNKLDEDRFITFEYSIKESEQYGDSLVITHKTIKYGDRYWDRSRARIFMNKHLDISTLIANRIIDSLGENAVDLILKDSSLLKEYKRGYLKYVEKINEFNKKSIDSGMIVEMMKLDIPGKCYESVMYFYKTIEDVKENIYDLQKKCGVSFSICDKIALKLGYDPNDVKRSEGFSNHLIQKSNNKGIMYVHETDIIRECKEGKYDLKAVLSNLVMLEWGDDRYYTSKHLKDAEAYVEKICTSLIQAKPKKICNKDLQMQALLSAKAHLLSIVTGGPGKGKSYVIKSIVRKLHKTNKIYVLAPTGAAVGRLRKEDDIMEHSSGVRTIHSFMFNVVEKSYEDSERDVVDLSELIESSKDVLIIIDEMSMVDLLLFYDLLKSIEPIHHKLRLVLVGDADQLPSIKGGDVLRDLINSDKIPVTELVKQYRTESPEINDNAARALNGKDLVSGGNFIVLETPSSDLQTRTIQVLKKEGISPDNSCIICPMKGDGRSTGVHSLNKKAQNHYNPSDDNYKYRIGDKVIQGINNRDLRIYNGSELTVKQVEYNFNKDYPTEMVCRYMGSRVEYKINRDQDGLIISDNSVGENKVDLAYALTVHKAQGKGYGTVIIVLRENMSRLLNRNLFYTAITRASKKCIIICDKRSLKLVKRSGDDRVTDLFAN